MSTMAVTAGDGFEPLLESLDLERRLVVDVAEQPLSEVGDLRARKAADEALHADDPDLDRPDLQNEVLAVEHVHPAVLEHTAYLVLLSRVVVVVPEDRDDRSVEARARIGEHSSLLGQPVRRQVAGEQHQVGLSGQGTEAAREPLAKLLRGMEISRRREANLRRHGVSDTRSVGCTNRDPGIRAPCRPRRRRRSSASSSKR
jgi:hypothetical protein